MFCNSWLTPEFEANDASALTFRQRNNARVAGIVQVI